MTAPGRELVDLALVDPELALRRAGAVLAGRRADAATRVAARHAAASAWVELGEFTTARRVALRAFGAAVGHRAELGLLLAWIEHNRGDLDASERYLAALPARLPGALAARARCVRGLNLCVGGDYDRAVPVLTSAIVASRRRGDIRWEANGLVGRGVVRSLQLRLAAAEADLAAAQRLCAARGESDRAASCLHNRGFVAAQAGDIPRALSLFDEAERAGVRAPEAMVDRANTLLAGGLVADAGEALSRASALLDDAGRGLRLAEACLALGECALRAGDLPMARHAARRASALFRGQRRAAWVTAARALELRIHLAERAGASAAEAGLVAARAERYGFRLEAAWLRVAAAEVAEPRVARRLLRAVERERVRGPAALRAAGWLARARLAALDGRSVLPACRAGLGVVDRYAAGMGAPELRAGVAGLAAELARTGLGAAVRAGDPRTVLAWVERGRIAASRIAPVRPPEDPALRAALVELRDARGGAPRRVAALEEAVRRLSFGAKGSTPSRAESRLDGLDRLGATALLSYWVADGELGVVSVVDRRARLHRLGKAGGWPTTSMPCGSRPGCVVRPSGWPPSGSIAPSSRRCGRSSAIGHWSSCPPGSCGTCRGRRCPAVSGGRCRSCRPPARGNRGHRARDGGSGWPGRTWSTPTGRSVSCTGAGVGSDDRGWTRCSPPWTGRSWCTSRHIAGSGRTARCSRVSSSPTVRSTPTTSTGSPSRPGCSSSPPVREHAVGSSGSRPSCSGAAPPWWPARLPSPTPPPPDSWPGCTSGSRRASAWRPPSPRRSGRTGTSGSGASVSGCPVDRRVRNLTWLGTNPPPPKRNLRGP
nr:hypothetical protein [Actinophytocola sp.]